MLYLVELAVQEKQELRLALELALKASEHHKAEAASVSAILLCAFFVIHQIGTKKLHGSIPQELLVLKFVCASFAAVLEQEG